METKIYTKDNISEIVQDLKDNKVLAVRTDTVMGLIAIGNSEKAFNNLVEVKNRPSNKLFPIMVSSVKQLESITTLSKSAKNVVQRFLPGEITLIVDNEDDSILVDSESIAVRIVNDDVLIKIVSDLKQPIFLTSANKSGEATTKLASEVLEIFDGEIAGIIMEDAKGYDASTIVDVRFSEPKIVREGKISLKDIEKVWRN